jgi:hypothetical protein
MAPMGSPSQCGRSTTRVGRPEGGGGGTSLGGGAVDPVAVRPGWGATGAGASAHTPTAVAVSPAAAAAPPTIRPWRR